MKKGIFFATGLILSVMLMSGMVMAADSKNVPTTASVTIPGYRSLTLLNDPISFGDVNPGTTNSISSGSQLIARIGAETNVETLVTTKSEDTTFGIPTFPISSMTFAGTTIGIEPTTYATYSTDEKPACTFNAAGGGDCTIFHRLSVPYAIPAATYTADVTIIAKDLTP